MITNLLQITDAAIGAALPVTTRHIYASLQGGQPVVHTGGGNFTPIANDLTGFWSYQRLRGEVSVIKTTLAGDPCDALQVTVPLRIVALLDRDGCIDQAERLVEALKASRAQVVQAAQVASVVFDRIAWSFDTNAPQEFSPMPAIPTHRTFLVADVTVIARGKASCMADCEPLDVTCSIIAAATLDKIRECLGDRLAELCDAPVCPCDPLTYELRNAADEILASGSVNDPCGAELGLQAPDGIMTFDGQPFITVPSGSEEDIDCNTPVNAAYAENGGAVTGTYRVTGTANGREVFTLDASHRFEYTDANWRLIRTGSDYDAAPGSETKPWDADWSATPVTVTQATIGSYCAVICPREVFLRAELEAGDDASVTHTIDADSEGIYTSITQDGGSGTLEVSINGGAFGAFVDPTPLTIGDTIAMRRSVFASSGFIKISGTY